MKKVSNGIAFLLIVFLGNAISQGFMRGDAQLQYRGANQMLIAESGGNPWARTEPRQQRSGLPAYVTNPRYATEEDRITVLNRGNMEQNSNGTSAQQQQLQQQQYQQQQYQQQQYQQQYPQQQYPQQQLQQQLPGYGAGIGLPQVPQIYAPYSTTQYGYQPGYPTYPTYPTYPGAGGVPGLGTPYMGNITGFGGNPLVTPYGNIYGNVVPYQQTAPPSDAK